MISDKDLIKCGIVAKVEEVLKENQTSYEIDAEVKPNPTIENVIYGLELYKKSGSDFIIAVGGGSVIDTAKAIAVIANNPENADVVSLEGMVKSSHPAVPIIALPTTAGTGSETTMDYVITNTKEKRKMACMVPRLFRRGDSGYGDHGIPSFETDSGNCYGCPDSCSRILPVAGGVLLFRKHFP